MIDKCDFVNIRGQTWQFNTADNPLKNYEVNSDIRPEGDDQERMQEHGTWPHRTYMGKVLIHLTGDLMRDTASAYIAARMSMLDIIYPQNEIQVERKLGTLYLKYTGMGEDMKGDVTIDGGIELPIPALYPTVTEYHVTFKAFSPFFTGASSGRNYHIG
jgi:hypothetical protein